ncbi:MAG: AbrB/MazE/SpoVT family DNA-binding domain-containing protein [Nitrospirae bacterium]|nr:AbrB/MazE/SpoVT family DNA-binding domain-containing protein [Nitrospirota bacterium]
MNEAKTVTAEVKTRGQLTIPKKIREKSHIDEGSIVSILPVGDSLIITPKKLGLDEARRELRRLLKSSGFSADDLVADLDSERDNFFRETYGKNKKI